MQPAPIPPSTSPKRVAAHSLLLAVGSLGPLGYAPASGTVAVAVAGIPLCWIMTTRFSTITYAAVTVLFTILAMALHHVGDRILGESDSRRLVWDELAGFFIAMFMVDWSWKLVAVAFVAERLIDIAKVPPADLIERKMHSGVGVVLDDVVAGVYTCLLLHALVHLFPSLAR